MAKAAVAEKLKIESPATVFPLALTPFEKYFLWDDRPEQPMTPIVELQFSTPLNVAAMEQAIAVTVAHNPIMNSIVVGPDHDVCWQLSDEPVRLRCSEEDPPTKEGRLQPIDLRREPGARFWYERTATGSRLLWQLHHCVCDGVAMRAVMIDVLLNYALATGVADAARLEESLLYERFDPLQLVHRYDFSHLPPAKRRLTFWQRLKNAHYFHFLTPRPLRSASARDSVSDQSGVENELLCHQSLDRSLTERVFEKCQATEVGVNELSLAILFRTCAEWNRSLGDKNGKSRLRLMMPFDLRGRNDLRMPATNRLSFVFLGRNYQQCDDFDSLLKSIQRELAAVRETNLHLDLVNGLAAGAKWPRWMRWGLSKSNSMATAVLTYVGDVSRGMNRIFPEIDGGRPIGDAVLQSVMASPPVRRNTNIAIGLCVNWGQIYFSASWNRAQFSGRDCEKFLELYKTGWQRWCDDKE